jgi:hypothetical protein
MRLLLEAYYEPQFSRSSHGFRPQRGCHTALSDIYDTWTGTTWFIEGDIAQCYDSLDHQVLLSILREKIHLTADRTALQAERRERKGTTSGHIQSITHLLKMCSWSTSPPGLLTSLVTLLLMLVVYSSYRFSNAKEYLHKRRMHGCRTVFR